MSVDRAEVLRIASLARLELEPAEAERLTGEMNRILAFADRLGEAAEDGSSDPRGESPGPGGVRDSAAEVADPLSRDIEALAPRAVDGFFVVPPLPGVTPDSTDDPDGDGR